MALLIRLGEALREHSRDLLLLSATPHQGDHFRFWMLVRLLDPRLFQNPDDMLENRHRLNVVVFRRTQAAACDAGSPVPSAPSTSNPRSRIICKSSATDRFPVVR